MLDTEEFLTASVDDYLIGLAESIHQAQQQLNQMSVITQDNQAPIRYHLPRVDFELKVSFELSRSTNDTQTGSSAMVLKARPIGGESSSQSSAEAASVIKGSFVAVPSEGGKPPPVITTSLKRLSMLALEITVNVQSAAGEKLSDVEVQFNIDKETSYHLNQTVDLSYLDDNTNLDDSLILTNSNGLAVSTLHADEKEVEGTHIAILIDVLGKTETIIFKIEP